MKISEFRDLLANDGFAATFQTMGQYRTELLQALDKLRAQADARPVATVRVTHGGYGMELSTHVAYALPEGKHDLYTHPEASAPPMCVKCGDGIMAHDPGTCGNCHAMGDEASAPGLSEGWKQAAEWLRDHYQDYSNVGSLVDAMRARASAATQPNEADK